MLKAKINNQIVSVKVVNNNYNNHAKEVIIKEGTNKGRYAIVENKDFIIESYKQLIELCVLDIEAEDIEEHHITELINNDTIETIKKFASNYTLSKSDYYKIITHFNYESCTNINEVKEALLIDSIQDNINGIKSSFTSVKNRVLKEV